MVISPRSTSVLRDQLYKGKFFDLCTPTSFCDTYSTTVICDTVRLYTWSCYIRSVWYYLVDFNKFWVLEPGTSRNYTLTSKLDTFPSMLCNWDLQHTHTHTHSLSHTHTHTRTHTLTQTHTHVSATPWSVTITAVDRVMHWQPPRWIMAGPPPPCHTHQWDIGSPYRILSR